MKSARNSIIFILKIFAGLLIALGIYFGIKTLDLYYQSQINGYTEEIRSFNGSMITAATELEAAIEPELLKLRQKGVIRSYVEALKATSKRIEPERYPEVHSGLFSLPFSGSRINTFNKAVASDEFNTALRAAKYSMRDSISLLNYQVESMKILANILEYDPVQDMDTENIEILAGRLYAAGEGIAATRDSLDAVKEYPDDTKKQVKAALVTIEAARFSLFQSVSEQRIIEAEKQAYIKSVADAQSVILLNRQEFWAKEKTKILNALQTNKLEKYSYRLQN